MDQLALQSTFSKLRNPYGLRRWAYMIGSADATPDARLDQLFGHAGQPFGENNAPMLITRVAEDQTVAQLVPFRDQWERPAKRWFKATLSTVGSLRVVSVAAGTPFLAEDPFQAGVQFRARPGDDLILDDGMGTFSIAKVSIIDPIAAPSGNAVGITSRQGVTLPADGVYYVNHSLDAFLVNLTVSYMVPLAQESVLDPVVHVNPFQSKIQVTYFDNDGSTVVEQYGRVPIRELSTIATDVPFASIEVLGDRFGVVTTPLTEYIQVFEVFEIVLARAPDKLEVIFDNNGPTGGGTDVDVGNAAVYYGTSVPAAAQVPANVFPPSGNPAPTTRYNVYPPPDPEDFWTGSGDIVVMPVGTLCPAGFEDIGQVVSRANDHYVVDTATGEPVTFSTVGGPPAALVMSLVSGNTLFTGTFPAGAVDPSTGTSLLGGQNNTATFEIVFLMANHSNNFASNQVMVFRIPEIAILSTGVFTFTIPGDVRALVGQPNLIDALDSRIFISGIVQADSLTNAGEYAKPFQDEADATAVEGVAEAAELTQVGIPLETVLVSPGDLIVFVDSSGNPVAEISTGGGDFTGPEYRVVSINEDANTVEVIDRKEDDALPNRSTEVWRFVASTAGGGGVPPVFQANFYRVFAANTQHTHAVQPSDADVKARDAGGHFVSSLDHVHGVTPQATIPPFVSFKLCVKL